MKHNMRSFLLLPVACFLAACDSNSSEQSADSSSPVSEETSAVTSLPDETSEPSSSIPVVDFTLETAQAALVESKPTKIVTSHEYRLPSNGVELTFNSTLLIDYSGEVTCSYSYVYQVLAEIGEDNQNYYRTISGKKYSVGAQVGDGVEWVNNFEGATTLTKLNINFAMDVLDEEKLIVEGTPEDSTAFLGGDYGVSDLSFSIGFEPGGKGFRVDSFVMDFKMEGYAGLTPNETAVVHSESIYTYEPVQVVLP